MAEIKIPASRVRQGDLTLYTTSLRVRELVSEGFYNVETLDPEDTNQKGYQRLLNKARAKQLSDYIAQGQDSHDAFYPRQSSWLQIRTSTSMKTIIRLRLISDLSGPSVSSTVNIG